MKKGNVIATGVKGGATVKRGTLKESPLKRRAEKNLPSTSNSGVKEDASEKKETGAKGDSAVKAKADAKVNLAAQKFLSVAQVAERWGASETTVRRIIEEGRLNGIRLRHACRLSLESVVEYEKSTHF